MADPKPCSCDLVITHAPGCPNVKAPKECIICEATKRALYTMTVLMALAEAEARAIKAEARVKELEEFLLRRPACKIACGHDDCGMVRAILARQKEESK